MSPLVTSTDTVGLLRSIDPVLSPGECELSSTMMSCPSTRSRQPDAFPLLVNTPALFNLFATAPYLHDGSVATLRDRLLDDADGRHGHTSSLTEEERADLEAYLLTL